MNKKVMAILAAIVLAAIGVGLVAFYAINADKRALDNAELVDVIQVTNRIDAGTSAEEAEQYVKEVRLPKVAVVKGAIKSLDEIEGLSATVALEPGEQLIKSRFAKDGLVVSETEATLPRGYQELTLPMSEARVVGGTVKAGDRVGLYGSDEKDGDGYTTVIEHQVLVLRIRQVGATTEGNNPVAAPTGDKEGQPYMVTVAVKTQSAIFGIAYYEFGKLYLTKQNSKTEKGQWPELGKLSFGQLADFVKLARQ